MLNSKLQYISSGDSPEEQYERIIQALANGITWVQIRFKKADDATFLALAQKVKALQAQYAFTLIINDRAAIAKQIDSDGLHLGLDDMPIREARELLGEGKIIGGTANNLTDVQQRIGEGCDYIGLGPLRFTSSKEKLSPELGYEGFAEIYEQTKAQSQIPIYAIGGVVDTDIEPLLSAGIYGIALCKHIENNFNDKHHITKLKQLLHE